ncbi:unnamed protein product [Merluccius merluccius]
MRPRRRRRCGDCVFSFAFPKGFVGGEPGFPSNSGEPAARELIGRRLVKPKSEAPFELKPLPSQKCLCTAMLLIPTARGS